MAPRVQLKKETSDREHQEAWHQEELIDGNPPVIK
jgi:hypothetical protein